MKRHPNWRTRLHLFIHGSKDVTFDWGTDNCGLFVAHWIREATGVNVGAPYVGNCSDEASAEALFLNGHADLGSFAAAIAAANGMPEVTPVTFARRGDAVWVDNGTVDNPSKYGALGVVGLDGRFAVCMSEQGVKRVHMQRWKRAWRVG
jgi:hypothetical protein